MAKGSSDMTLEVRPNQPDSQHADLLPAGLTAEDFKRKIEGAGSTQEPAIETAPVSPPNMVDAETAEIPASDTRDDQVSHGQANGARHAKPNTYEPAGVYEGPAIPNSGGFKEADQPKKRGWVRPIAWGVGVALGLGGVGYGVVEAIGGSHGPSATQSGSKNPGQPNGETGGNQATTLDPALQGLFPENPTAAQLDQAIAGPITNQQFAPLRHLHEQGRISKLPNMWDDFYSKLSQNGPYTQAGAEKNAVPTYDQLAKFGKLLGDKLPFANGEYAKSVLFGGKGALTVASEGDLQAAIAEAKSGQGEGSAMTNFIDKSMHFVLADNVSAAINIYEHELIKTNGHVSSQAMDYLKTYVTTGLTDAKVAAAYEGAFESRAQAALKDFSANPSAYKPDRYQPRSFKVVSAKFLGGYEEEFNPSYSIADVEVTLAWQDKAAHATDQSTTVMAVEFVRFPQGAGQPDGIVGLLGLQEVVPGTFTQIQGQ